MIEKTERMEFVLKQIVKDAGSTIPIMQLSYLHLRPTTEKSNLFSFPR